MDPSRTHRNEELKSRKLRHLLRGDRVTLHGVAGNVVYVDDVYVVVAFERGYSITTTHDEVRLVPQ